MADLSGFVLSLRRLVMLIDRSDGKCYECEGQLEVTDADDCSMTVVCIECGECFTVEPDAFGDG